MEIIRSPQNATLRRLASLRNHRRRRASGSLLVDGPRETLRAIEAGLPLRGFYEPLSDVDRLPAGPPELLAVRAHAQATDCHRGIAPGLFGKISYGEGTDRCVAELEAPRRTLADLPTPLSGLVLVLDGLEKPGNLGAIFRTADAAGVSAVLLSDCRCDAFNSNAIRGSLGAVFTVPHAAGSADELATCLTAADMPVFGMRVEGARSLYETDLRGNVAVILGSEAHGLSDRWRHVGPSEVPGIMIPMAGRVDSLNVSVSAAIVAFEAVRQRR